MNRDLNVLCYGGGVNTVALLLELTAQGLIFDAIVFADTAGESEATYQHIALMSKWCVENGQPEITVVRNVDRLGNEMSLYVDCVSNQSLPSIAYGFKTCSQKFKIFPQNKFMNNWAPAKQAWVSGFKVNKFIGYDADESHRMGKNHSDEKYNNVYKLVDWGWGRFECVKRIMDSGIPLPPKSSCTFCPSMKAKEVIGLYQTNPKAFFSAVTMERAAQQAGNLITVKGLGRDWAWWDLIVAYRYFNWFKRHETLTSQIHPKIESMVRRVNRSQKVKRVKRKEVQRSEATAVICDIFRTPNEVPCGCYDGGSEE